LQVNYVADDWLRISEVPCVGGQWNDFDIQIYDNNPLGTIFIDGIVLTEAYEYGGTKMTYVPSSGSRILGNFRSGEEPADT
jgi:hypothetical protein